MGPIFQKRTNLPAKPLGEAKIIIAYNNLQKYGWTSPILCRVQDFVTASSIHCNGPVEVARRHRFEVQHMAETLQKMTQLLVPSTRLVHLISGCFLMQVSLERDYGEACVYWSSFYRLQWTLDPLCPRACDKHAR